ncbi:MAG TPA: hypothetical protein VG738_19630 [Chitinophagaceae bacterium]|nr:hypothetical protein [Chitinophagaceae bacterium]
MLNSVTWKQFLEVVVLSWAGYYAIVVAIFFKPELRKIFSYRPLPAPGGAGAATPALSPDLLMPEIYDCMAAVKELLERASAGGFPRAELIFGLQHLLVQYPAIKASRFVPSINNELIQLSDDFLGQPFTDDEITAIWN